MLTLGMGRTHFESHFYYVHTGNCVASLMHFGESLLPEDGQYWKEDMFIIAQASEMRPHWHVSFKIMSKSEEICFIGKQFDEA